MQEPFPRHVAPALSIRALDKRYGAQQVLDAIELEVPEGAAFGLVGANGAGKTTLLKCLLDLCAADRGSIEIFGVPHREPRARARLAFLPERFVPPHYLTGREFIALMCSLDQAAFDDERVASLLAELELEPGALTRPVRQLSKGMTQKLGLASCFLAQRDLYILDEPMSGLDPASRVAVKAVLARLTCEGRTLLFTSHVLADVEEMCSSITVIAGGTTRFSGPPDELCARYSEHNLEKAFIRCIRSDGHQPASHV